MGLAGYEHRITYKLSGGEKRLVALATVLAMQPDGVAAGRAGQRAGREGHRRGCRVARPAAPGHVVVSHQQEFCRRVTCRTVSLVEGRILPADGNAPEPV